MPVPADFLQEVVFVALGKGVGDLRGVVVHWDDGHPKTTDPIKPATLLIETPVCLNSLIKACFGTWVFSGPGFFGPFFLGSFFCGVRFFFQEGVFPVRFFRPVFFFW